MTPLIHWRHKFLNEMWVLLGSKVYHGRIKQAICVQSEVEQPEINILSLGCSLVNDEVALDTEDEIKIRHIIIFLQTIIQPYSLTKEWNKEARKSVVQRKFDDQRHYPITTGIPKIYSRNLWQTGRCSETIWFTKGGLASTRTKLNACSVLDMIIK